jgi:hypothetical protein
MERAVDGVQSVAEVEDVLARSDLMQASRLTAAERDELLDIFIARAELNFPGLRCLAPGPFLKEMAP